jgi:hypothetical protein
MIRYFVGTLTQRIFGTGVNFFSTVLIESEHDLLDQSQNAENLVNAAVYEQDEDGEYTSSLNWLIDNEPEIIFSISVQDEITDPTELIGIRKTCIYTLTV